MQYDKPYMSTYVKVSMFSLYLFGFVAYPPWRRQFIRCACDDYPGQYQLVIYSFFSANVINARCLEMFQTKSNVNKVVTKL